MQRPWGSCMCDMFKEPQGGWCGLSGVSDEEEGGGVQVECSLFGHLGLLCSLSVREEAFRGFAQRNKQSCLTFFFTRILLSTL